VVGNGGGKLKTVAIVNHSAYGGGAEQGMVDIASCLDPEEYRVLAVLPERGDLAELLESGGAEVITVPLKRLKKTANPLTLAAYLCAFSRVVPRLARIFREREIEIVHANSNTAQLYAGPAAKIAGKPCVWHSRDLVNLGPLGPLLARTSDLTICISDAVLKHVSSFSSNQQKLVRIYNGIDAEQYEAAGQGECFREEMRIGGERFVVASVGQLVPWKKHRLFLDSARLIADRIQEALFLVIGDDMFRDHPGYIDELKQYAVELGIGEQVKFTGYREDMGAVYDGIDVLVHAASREPFGRVVAEVMAGGKPVVAVDTCGPSEIIRDGKDGVLVKPDDPVAMAAAVTQLAQDRELAARLGTAARERIAHDFSLTAFGEGLEEVYRRVLRGKGT
jgi:glycosyltransferase involved in cell wall biosynthesis